MGNKKEETNVKIKKGLEKSTMVNNGVNVLSLEGKNLFVEGEGCVTIFGPIN